MRDQSERRYYVAHKGRKHGPLSLVELASRRLTDDMQAWREDLPDWVPICEIEELRPFVRSAAASRIVDPPGQSWSGAARPYATPAQSDAAPVLLPPLPAAPLASQVKFLGLTMIGLAGIGLLCCPLGLLGALNPPLSLTLHDVLDQRLVTGGRSAIHGILLCVSIVMLAAGIGLLRGRRWGRNVSLIASAACVATYLAAIAFDYCCVFLPLMQAVSQPDPDPSLVQHMPGLLLGNLYWLAGMLCHLINLAILNSATVHANLR